VSEQNFVPEGAEPAPPAPEPGVGEQLRAAREQQGLSVIDVAQRLKFAPRQIEALEADNVAALPGLTFVRGFVRSYAKLLGLDADPLVGALERAAARDVGPSTVQLQSLTATPQPFPMRNTSASGSAWPWVLAMIVAVVGLGGFALYQWQAPESLTQPAAPAPRPAQNATPLTPPNVTPLATDPAPATSGAAVSAPAAAEPAKAEAAKAEGAKANANPEAGKGKIRLVFSGESWTEVRQAGGQIVFSRQSAAGSEAWVDGQPPFDFVIGNAQAVKLYYRGSEVDLKPYIKVTVARMQLK
jgi:cytoskeleton protein RodZ